MDDDRKKLLACAAISIEEIKRGKWFVSSKVCKVRDAELDAPQKTHDKISLPGCNRKQVDDVHASDSSQDKLDDVIDVDFNVNDEALFVTSVVNLLGTVSLLSMDKNLSFGKIVPCRQVLERPQLNGPSLHHALIVITFLEQQIISWMESVEMKSPVKFSGGNLQDIFPRLQFGLSVVDWFHRFCEDQPSNDVDAKTTARRVENIMNKCFVCLFDKAFGTPMDLDKMGIDDITLVDSQSQSEHQKSNVEFRLNALRSIVKLAINCRFKYSFDLLNQLHRVGSWMKPVLMMFIDMIAVFILKNQDHLNLVDGTSPNLIGFLESTINVGIDLATSLDLELFASKPIPKPTPSRFKNASTDALAFPPMSVNQMKHPEKMALRLEIEKILDNLMTSTEDLTLLMPNYCRKVFGMYSILHHIMVKLRGKKRSN